MAAQVTHANPGKQEEPRVIGDQFQMRASLFGSPAQPLIAGGGFPGGRTKQQTRQGPALAVFGQVLEVLPQAMAVSQLMVARQQKLE
jgi:hypothetical protein